VYTDHAATHAWTVARDLTPADVDRILGELRAQGGDAIAVRLDETLFGDGRDLASATRGVLS
jgi:hypothetical protein